VAWAVAQAPDVVDGATRSVELVWSNGLGLSIELRLDGLALLMVLIVAGIGVLVCLYALRYFSASTPGLGRLAGPLVLFGGAMTGLVLSDQLLTLFVFWELTTVTSYLLIGWTDGSARSRAAALQAILVTGAGGLAMLGGIVLLGEAAGTYRLSAIVADPPSGTTVSVALVLVLIGAFTKSAQTPFSFWLPGAMAAPTPISTFLHSATMVKAGVYLVARLAPAYGDAAVWRPLVLTVGLLTMVIGGVRALRQFDLKLLLAYGTVSQLGFLTVLLGAGYEAASKAGIVVLLAHALFKATLFMVVGIIDHQAHTRDLRALHLGGPGWRGTLAVAAASAASMAGIPLLFGFVGKESAYEAFLHDGDGWAGVVLAATVLGSVCTVAYAARFVWGAFRSETGRWDDAPEPVVDVPPPRMSFLAPTLPLAALTVVLGVLPGLADGLVGAALASLYTGDPSVHLKVWHGFNTALTLSALTLAAGFVLFAARVPVARALGRAPALPTGETGYLWSLRALNRGADRLTGVVQTGSLPIYAAVILATALLVPGIALLGAPWPGWPELTHGPVELAIVTLIVTGAVVVARTGRRFAAALTLGTVGYGMAILFAVYGAPDLALTQFAIETLSVVLFVMVLRFLPERFVRSRAPSTAKAVRLGVSVLVGVVVTAFLIVANGARSEPPISSGFVDRALPEGGGRNVVNVILVDFRALDTLGEITVLLVAAVGALALALGGRRAVRRNQESRP